MQTGDDAATVSDENETSTANEADDDEAADDGSGTALTEPETPLVGQPDEDSRLVGWIIALIAIIAVALLAGFFIVRRRRRQAE